MHAVRQTPRRRINVRITGALALSVLIGTTSAVPAGADSHRKWSLSVSNGGISAPGRAEDLESAMRAAGFDHTFPEQCLFPFGCIPAQTYPQSQPPHDAAGVRLSRSLRHSLAVSVSYGSTDTGETAGYNASNAFVRVESHVEVLSLLVSLEKAAERVFELSLGMGPALYRIETDDGQSGRQVDTKPGLVFDFTTRVPARTRLFIAVELQYRWLGKTAVGPFTGRSNAGTVTLPETDVSFSHATATLGIGVRF